MPTYQPPWLSPPPGGVRFTIPGIENVPDLCGDIVRPDLVVFFGGNQFMALSELMAAFQEQYGRRRIFYETLPPGIIERQLRTGSLVVGHLKIEITPDLFVAGVNRIERLHGEGFFRTMRPYFCNRLAIMVHRGNPKGLTSVADLAAEDILVSMPNVETEGIAQKAVDVFRRVGGDDLVHLMMHAKINRGEMFITRIHHRETPLRILAKKSDAGPVWVTEAIFQQRLGHAIDWVEIPATINIRSVTAAGVLNQAPHMEAAMQFLEFLQSGVSQEIYRRCGFEPFSGDRPQD